MARLLSQRAAAKRVGLGVKKFRLICRLGHGPRVFDPLADRPLYVDTVLDEWLEQRDDRRVAS